MSGFYYDSVGAWIPKDPDAVLDYGIDWSAWLAAGDSVETSAWTVASGLVGASPQLDGTVASIMISGGTAGQTYTVTNRITTANGRTEDRSFRVKVAER